MNLIDSALLSRAIEVQKRCYRFLQLIRYDQIDFSGNWSIGKIHDDSTSEADRFGELVKANFLNLPNNSQPISANEDDINDFANFFVSYLFCSFDIISDSQSRLVQVSEPISDGSCWCELCTRLTDAPNLKLKKVTGWNKSIADSLEEEALRKLILIENVSVSEENISNLLDNSDYIETRALIAYGVELIRRCNGEEVDASSLVLWRRFAWEKNGVPKKNFTLTVETISDAETKLLSKLKKL